MVLPAKGFCNMGGWEKTLKYNGVIAGGVFYIVFFCYGPGNGERAQGPAQL